jgi:hypothetical protein
MNDTDMDYREAILAAHVAYEVQRYQDENLKATVAEEIALLWQWFAPRKVNAVLTPTGISEWIRRTAVTLELPDAVRDLVSENLTVAVETLQEDQSHVEAILPRAVYDQVVTALAGMTSLRQEIVHQFVTSSVYTMLISDVLYRGIKGFVLTENALAKNIPGASSFMKLGQNALNAAAPKLEKNVDKQLTAFINANIQNTIQESEQFLNKGVDGEALSRMGDEIWQANAGRPIASVSGHFDAGARQGLLEASEAFWRHFRETELFMDLVNGAVRTFFLRYGKQELGTLLNEFGYPQARIADEVYEMVRPIVAEALASGYLEARTITRLDGFYAGYFAR